MPFHKNSAVRYYKFDIFAGMPLNQAVFTRRGGVSEGQWSSLNVGLTVGDQEENVARNREISFASVGENVGQMSDSWLVHGTDVVVYDQPRPPDQESPPKADIVMTDNPAVNLFMRYADCVPILLYDSVKRAAALAHSGWRGTVQKVGRAAVQGMVKQYGSRPQDLLAAVGPSIGPNEYEIGAEVVEAVRAAFGEGSQDLLPEVNGSQHFDLWEANRRVLEEAGVTQIEVSEICTSRNQEDWFSHRGEAGKTGRFGILLSLND